MGISKRFLSFFTLFLYYPGLYQIKFYSEYFFCSFPIAYNSGIHGYRTVPVSSAGITLPPFPHSLYGTPAEKRSKPAIIGGPIQIRPKLPFVGPFEGNYNSFLHFFFRNKIYECVKNYILPLEKFISVIFFYSFHLWKNIANQLF